MKKGNRYGNAFSFGPHGIGYSCGGQGIFQNPDLAIDMVTASVRSNNDVTNGRGVCRTWKRI